MAFDMQRPVGQLNDWRACSGQLVHWSATYEWRLPWAFMLEGLRKYAAAPPQPLAVGVNEKRLTRQRGLALPTGGTLSGIRHFAFNCSCLTRLFGTWGEHRPSRDLMCSSHTA